MAATPGIAALRKAGVPHEVLTFDHDRREQSFGTEAVKALTAAAGIQPGQIYKTLIIAVPSGLAVAIVPATGRLSLKAATAALRVAKASWLMPRSPSGPPGTSLVRFRRSVSASHCRRSSIPARWRGIGCSAAPAVEAGRSRWRRRT
jgi:hypothetical protein